MSILFLRQPRDLKPLYSSAASDVSKRHRLQSNATHACSCTRQTTPPNPQRPPHSHSCSSLLISPAHCTRSHPRHPGGWLQWCNHPRWQRQATSNGTAAAQRVCKHGRRAFDLTPWQCPSAPRAWPLPPSSPLLPASPPLPLSPLLFSATALSCNAAHTAPASCASFFSSFTTCR